MTSFSSLHHSFDVNVASLYGIEEAILIHHFQHWIKINRQRRKNFFEGRTYAYMTYQDIADHFPYLSYAKVRNTIRCLMNENILIKGNFNKRKGDNTIWFAFHEEERFVAFASIEEKQSFYGDLSKLTGVCQNSQGSVKNDSALPDTKKDTKKEREREGASTPRTFSGISKIKREDHVFTTKEEHDLLGEKFGIEIRDAAYKLLNEWKLDTPKSKWKKDDNRSIQRWVIDALKERKKKEKNFPDESKNSVATQNKIWALKILKSIVFREDKKMAASEDAIWISQGRESMPIGYAEVNFREIITNKLQAWGLLKNGNR